MTDRYEPLRWMFIQIASIAALIRWNETVHRNSWKFPPEPPVEDYGDEDSLKNAGIIISDG